MDNFFTHIIASNSLYTMKNAQISIAGATFNYPKISPSGSGHIDILNSYKWKNDGSVDEVPYITMTEYTLNYGIWTSNVLRLLSNINVASNSSGSGTDPYGSLYMGKQTGFTYAFPFLVKPNNSIMSGGIRNEWAEINPSSDMVNAIPTSVGGAIKRTWELGNTIANSVGNIVSPGYGSEKIFNYSNTQIRDVKISFPLYNTLDVKSAIDNFNFVNLFALQNVKTRTTYLTYIPPKLYIVDSFSMGGIYMPVAFVYNFDVFAIGTTRKITDYSSSGLVASGQDGILIPEAYRVEITMRELIPQSSNIMSGTLGGQKTWVINSSSKPNPEVIDNKYFSKQGTIQQMLNSEPTLNPNSTLNLKPNFGILK